jgi:MFS family permease
MGQISLHSSMAGLRMSAPLQALSDGFGTGAVGVLIALFAAAAMLLALPAGKLADRHGSRLPALAAIGMSFAGSATAAVSQHFAALCVGALLSGAAANIGMISMQRSASRMAETPGQLRRVFGWLGVAPALSSFVGPLTAGFLIDHTGFRGAFIGMTLLPLLGLLAVRYLPQEAPRPPEPAAPDAPRARQGTWALMGSPQMRRLLLVNWLLSACWDVHGFVLPILGYQRGLSASAIGTVLGAFAVAVGVIRVILPMLTDKVSESRVLTTAMVLAGVVFCIYPLMSTAWGMGACAIALGLVLGGSQPVIMSTLHQITPQGRHGESIALRSLTLNMSSTALPLLFGMVGTAIGAGALFWVMSVVVGAGSFSARRVSSEEKVGG